MGDVIACDGPEEAGVTDEPSSYVLADSLPPRSPPRITNSDEATRLLKNGVLELKSITNAKSDVWSKYSLVIDKFNNETGFAACTRCFQCVVFKGRGTGTSSMKRHQCGVSNDQPAITAFISQEKKERVPREMKRRLVNECVKFVSSDLRPYEIVDGKGFVSLIQEVLNLQHESSRLLDASKILPHSTTVGRNVRALAENVQNELAEELKQAYEKGSVAYTSDMWQDSYNQRDFLTLTAHYINTDWVLISKVIATEQFNPELKKTGENIKSALNEVFERYGVETQARASVFTTDRGRNMICALKESTRIDCVAHILNTVLRHTFDPKEGCPEAVTGSLNASKSLVRYTKKCSIFSSRNIRLHQAAETRWNSTFLMVKSVAEQYEKIRAIMQQNAPQEMRRLRSIDMNIIETLVAFLKPFHEATEMLEGQNGAIIHRVIPAILDLKEHCLADPSDAEELTTLKSKALFFLNDKFEPHVFHKLAVFLNPRQKNMKPLTEEEKEDVIAYVKAWLNNVGDQNGGRNGCTTLPKKSKWDDDQEGIEKTNDLLKYKLLTVDRKDDTPVLAWWKGQENHLPNLGRLAKEVFAVQCTSAASERNFSCAGHVVSARRSRLSASSVDDILIMNSAFKNK